MGVYLDAEKIKELAELNVQIDVSYYALTPEYLNDEINGKKLSSIFESFETVKGMDKISSNEAAAMVKVLKMVEDHATVIQNIDLSYLVDDKVTEQKRVEVLEDIRSKLQLIQEAIKQSEYFSTTR